MSRDVLPKIAKIQARMVPPEGAVPHGQTPEGAQLYRLVQRRSRAVPWYDENTPDFHRDRKEFLRLQTAEQAGDPDVDVGSADRFWNSIESMHRVWAINEKTGEKSYRKSKPQLYDMVQIFYQWDEGNGNVTKVQWSPPTPEEEKAAARQLAIKQLGSGVLAEQMVDGGYTAADLLGLLSRSKQPAAEPEQQVDPQRLKCGCMVLAEQQPVAMQSARFGRNRRAHNLRHGSTGARVG